MEFRLTTEQKIFQSTLRGYCEKNIAPRSREIDDKEAGIPDELLKELAELGVFGVCIPEEYGGSSLPGEEMQYANIAVQEIARAELSMAIPVYTLLTIGWGGQFLKLYANEEVKRETLPQIASGEWFWGINVTEPGRGSDVANIKTTAVKKNGKYVINGEKSYISGVTETQTRGGGHCSLFGSDPAKGIREGMAFMAVMPNMLNGVTTTTYKEMGRAGLSSGSFVYNNSEVPENMSWARRGEVSFTAWKASI